MAKGCAAAKAQCGETRGGGCARRGRSARFVTARGAGPVASGPGIGDTRAWCPPARRMSLSRDVTAAPLQTALLAVVVALFTWASINLTRIEGGIASVWIANGVMVGSLLLRARRRWVETLAAGLAASLAVRLIHGDAPGFALGITAANLIEILIVVLTITRRVPDVRDPRQLVPLARIATASAIGACAVSGVLASALSSFSSGGFEARQLGFAWLVWFSAHLLGIVVVATLTVTAMRLGRGLFGLPGRRVDFALAVALLLAVSAVVFLQSRYPLLFLAYLPLMLLTFRHGFAGVVPGVAVLALVSSLAAIAGVGPFRLVDAPTALEKTLLLQIFVGAGCLMVLPVAVTMAERRRLLRRVQRAEAQQRAVADNMPAIIAHVDARGRYVSANAAAGRVLGQAPERLVGRHLRDVWGDAVYATLAPHVEGALAGVEQRFEGEADVAGRHRCYQSHFVPEVGPGGEVLGFYGLTFDISALKQAEQALEQLARQDPLTGVANRRQFDERLARALARSRRSHQSLALLALDLDRFKSINDSHGHAAGDAVLKAFARRIQDSVYEIDLVARLGGDEFVVLVEGAVSVEGAERVAAKIIAAMIEPIALDGVAVQAATSIGIAWVAQPDDPAALLALADRALYEAKRAGRGTWRVLTG